jgi:hypothetical protein
LIPKDIADIVVGQEVKVSLTAYDPSKFGRIDGNVTSVSADAISNQQTGEQYYLVDVSMRGTLYEDNGDEVIILPGMVASNRCAFWEKNHFRLFLAANIQNERHRLPGVRFWHGNCLLHLTER